MFCERVEMGKMGRILGLFSVAVLLMVMGLFSGGVEANMKSPPPERAKVIIIGDRVVDIAYNLGVVPEAMSVRASLWPMAQRLKTAVQILGCPQCITVKNPRAVPEALKRFDIHRIIIEKSHPFCIYKPEITAERIAAVLKDTGAAVEYVDFSEGLESAVHQTAALLHREDRVAPLMETYGKAMDKASAKLPQEKSGKKVLILNGVFQGSTGRTILRVEAPGGYTDRFFLDVLGFVNCGDVFKPEGGEAEKGYYMVRRQKGGVDLSPLLTADPDIIVMTGDVAGIQKALGEHCVADPAMAQMKALQSMALYALPLYVDSSVLEYPELLQQWAAALLP